MSDLVSLKQAIIDVFLGAKQFDQGSQQVAALKVYDPDLEVFRDSLTTNVIAGAKARRALLDMKTEDLKGLYGIAETHHGVLHNTVTVTENMVKQRVTGTGIPPRFVAFVVDARKKDLLEIEKNIFGPAIERYLKKWQNAYEFQNGQVVEKGEAEEEEEEQAGDPAVLKQAEADSGQIIGLMANEKTLFSVKSPLNSAIVNTFLKDKLSFLPNAVRGGDTKKLLSEERLCGEAIKQFEAACAKSPGVVDAAYEIFKVNGRAVRSGPTPLMVWKNKAGLLAHRDLLEKLLRNIREHLNFWMAQRTTARLDLKSKKVIACTQLAGEVDALLAHYQKVI